MFIKPYALPGEETQAGKYVTGIAIPVTYELKISGSGYRRKPDGLDSEIAIVLVRFFYH